MAEHNELTGQTIQGYHIQKPIGQGKFSIVYRAETTNNTIVALKKIKIFDILDPKQREKCLKEVKLMQPLDHPNIIKYIDSFIHNNELIIITEWAERGDLKKLIKNAVQEDTPFEELKIWEYALQISSALKQMHEKRIMHRDLKPANIFIAQDGNLKVGDLGLGRIFSSETIEAYSKVGTPLYMSPELLRGEGYDMRSDVWSLGCVLYELCEFKSPFRNDNEKMSLMDLFNKITKGEFQPISKKYSEELRNLINNMIIIDPQRRCDINFVFQVCEQMHDYLKKTPKIDSILVMEDIYEKLGILEYHSNFCKPLNKKPISKLCFALSEGELPNQEKFFYFCALCYWILNLPKCSNKSQAAISPNIREIFSGKRSNEELANKLITDMKTSGLRLGDQLNPSHLSSGYGDAICFLLNDLLNRELVRLNYKFDSPVFSNDEHDQSNLLEDESHGKVLEVVNNHFSDEEDKPQLIPQKFSAKSAGLPQQNNNNSRFTSATTRADELEEDGRPRTRKEEDEADPKKVIMISNIDVAAWKKENEKVERELEIFDEQIEKNHCIYQNKYGNEEFMHNFKELSTYAASIRNEVQELKSKGVERFIDKISNDIEEINFGEKIINEFSSQHIGKLKEMVEIQKTLFGRLNEKMGEMKEKIAQFDNLNNGLLLLKEKLRQKGEMLEENNEAERMQKAISQLKRDIVELNLRQSLIEKRLNILKSKSKT